MAMQLVLSLLILAMAGHSSATFCVCKSGLTSTDPYQKAIDYACGAGADCNPIRQNGVCYNPNSIQAHCSYAVNSYYQKNAGKGATCDFQGVGVLTNSDPSGGGCSYSATSGSTSTGGTPVTTVPTTSPTTPTSTPVTPVYGGGTGTTPVTPVSGGSTPTGTSTGTNPTTTSPYSTTPSGGTSTGVLGGGGIGSGMAPTGSMDDNHGSKLEGMSLGSALVALVISGIMCM